MALGPRSTDAAHFETRPDSPRVLRRVGAGACTIAAALALSACRPQGPSTGASGSTSPPATAAPAAPGPVVVTVARVERRPIRRSLAAVGTLNAFEKIVVTPRAEGRVLKLLHDVGDRVTAGASLLELDPTDAALSVAESERALEQELARLGVESLPPPDFDLEKLPGIVRARLVLENAELRLKRQQSLAEVDAAAREAVDQVETEVQIAGAALRQSRLDARATLATARQRAAALDLARHNLAEKRVVAPELPPLPGGTAAPPMIVAERLVSIGEMVRAFPSTPVFELVADEVLKLKAFVPERYLAQIRLDLAVEVKVEAYPGRKFPGRVARIHPTVDPRSRSFEVEVHVPNAERLLRHGSFAKADLILTEEQPALLVPVEAVVSFAGVNKVFRVRGDAVEEVLVEIGPALEGRVEATGALEENDRVVISGQSRLSRGSAVKVRDLAGGEQKP